MEFLISNFQHTKISPDNKSKTDATIPSRREKSLARLCAANRQGLVKFVAGHLRYFWVF